MTLDVFWERIETVMGTLCDECPVKEFAGETKTECICNKVGDCAEGLKRLHKMLQQREREGKMTIDEVREKFMTVVYDELSDDSDNCRANRIIDAADEYVEEVMRLEREG